MLLVVSVYLLRQDCWNWRKIKPVAFGFLPVGLWYHAAHSVLAAITMSYCLWVEAIRGQTQSEPTKEIWLGGAPGFGARSPPSSLLSAPTE